MSSNSKNWLFSPFLIAASLIMLLVVVLRIPTFAEPYWYGDEGIYLTIGNAMNNGAVLYKDIVDHKTPLIYYFARVGSQLSFRLLLTVWMTITSLAFLASLYRLTRRLWLSTGIAAFFVVLTSIPLLEGTIPNGELFVMGFIIVGLYIFLRTNSGLLLTTASAAKLAEQQLPQRKEWRWWILTGTFLGGAILTKVPALFDALALFYIGWLAGWDLQFHAGWRWQWRRWKPIVTQWLLLGLGMFIPILLSIMYFVYIDAGSDYLQYGLLYNFHYVQNWTLGNLPGWAQTFFTLPAKAAVMVLVLLSLTFLGRWVSRPLRFATGWFYLALFAAILSNRPYPHYLLQIIPPLVLSIGLALHSVTAKKALANWRHKLITLTVVGSSLLFLYLIWVSLHISNYPTLSYYQSFIKLATAQISPIAYRDSFNTYLADNYAASSILTTSKEQHMFIWGTNPMLYALSKKQPVGKFTVAFHIQDLNLYQETIAAVSQTVPQYIVVMHNETTPLPGLEELLNEKYYLLQQFEHFTIWRRKVAVFSPQQPPRQ